MTEVVTFGETMALIKADTPGPLAHVRGMSLGIGGAESNFAIALARLGTSVTWVGRVGHDSFGDLVLREIGAEGVRVVCARDEQAPTGLMIKERRTDELLRVWYYRAGSAGSRLSPADIPVDVVSGSRLLHVTGITPGLSASAAEATFAAVEIASAAGVTVSFDLNYRAKLWGPEQAAAVFRSLVERADVVFAGEDEAALVVGAAEASLQAQRLADLGPAEVVIKRGRDGALALVDGVCHQRPAVPIRAVDTVGAGDAFVAGYVAELLAGLGPAARLDTAVRVGAFACLVTGDWEGLPRRDELNLLEATEPVSR
ncbi:sugar kinase [Microlunatus panaciterrae]|uniref:2-dehydro-3-deoxygluconokinase n=1 Tax=Microlunatus panaciterrae TaxID=400768 RepID=A0ABS2RJ89_9ACTN|nr:sugar kinase [Microlunatus panaciterrae]MBM7799076.1 2-dehydro-3-deoxygluconokinase [Microlunatus panaciterrae]